MMKRFFAIGLAIGLIATGLLFAAAPGQAIEQEQRAISVLELFTSQGCNSCPPADRLLSELAEDPEILALSWNVDYWDYLGWSDTMAKPAHSRRQQAYNREIGRRGVFTPQIVVNGRLQCVGSNKESVESLMADDDAGIVLPLTIKPLEDYLVVSLPRDQGVENAVVLLVRYSPQVSVPVKGGENEGRVLTYTNVVTGHEVVGEWQGRSTRVMIERSKLGPEGNALLVQQGSPQGPILRAAIVETSN